MDAGLQVALSVGVPTLTVLVGILIGNSRMNDLRAHMDSKFTDLKNLFTAKLSRVEDVVDARLTRIEQELKIR
ncbi:MAG: hypothetical protein ABSF54_23805 [Bryobacteraceae bacterium]|jgi:hypothetical protein